MTFAIPSLLWLALPLLAVTLAVHLLNLRRQQVVAWAAMEFLLESEQRTRTWINLKEWLLLALRLLAIALAVFSLASPAWEGFQLSPLAASRLHHVIVLDDSFSMGDTSSNVSAWQDALAAVEKILSQAQQHPGAEVAILRTSMALATLPEIGQSKIEKPEIARASGAEQIERLRSLASQWKVSETAGRLLSAMDLADEEVRTAPSGVRQVVYVITDTRSKDWQPDTAVKERLEKLADADADLHWIRCVTQQNSNLSIAGLRSLPGPNAAGVEMAMQVTVANAGPGVQRNVLVRIRRDGRPAPVIDLGEIAPGEQASRQFAVSFARPGTHVVTAEIDADAVATDNRRFATVNVADQRKLLVVDGSPGGQESLAIAAALRSSKQLNTGWHPKIVSPQAFESSSDFSDFSGVILLDVSSFSAATAKAINKYVHSGGGLWIVLGPEIDAEFYNEHLLGDADDSLMPIHLDKPIKPVDAEESLGDVAVSEHFMFRVFAGERNSFLDLVRVNYMYGLQLAAEPSRCQTLMTHASGEPLMLSTHIGRGRVLLQTTLAGGSEQADERWSNLSTLPVYPVLALELAAYLAEPALASPNLVVGSEWASHIHWPNTGHTRLGRWRSDGQFPIVREADSFAKLPRPSEAGVYQIAGRAGSNSEGVVCAVNVEPVEGELTLVDAAGFDRLMREQGVQVHAAASLSTQGDLNGPSMLPPTLGAALLLLLFAEQALAVAASYHPARQVG